MIIRKRVFQPHYDDSRTKPEFETQCGIKDIIQRHRMVGLPVEQSIPLSNFGPSILMSYDEAHRLVGNATESFASLPAVIRARFKNDPRNMVEFLANEGNRSEAESLGLVIKKEPHPAPVPVSPLVVTGTTDSKLTEKA